MRLELERVHIDHDLPVAAAKRLRHGRTGHIGDLIAHVILARVAQLGFVQTFAFQRD